MNVILIAPPAAGKGTQAGLLKDVFNLYHLSTGDLLREIASSNTELGNEIKNLIDNGKLIDDELMVRLLKEKISSLKDTNGIIFDGFPRTINQAVMLDELLKEMNQTINNVIYLKIEKEIASKRATGRVTCPNCGGIYNIYFDTFKNENKCNNCNSELIHRQDDTLEKFNYRFDTFLENTLPLINYYEDKGILSKVDCTKDKEHIFNEIKSIIKKA